MFLLKNRDGYKNQYLWSRRWRRACLPPLVPHANDTILDKTACGWYSTEIEARYAANMNAIRHWSMKQLFLFINATPYVMDKNLKVLLA
jgi:hypothetical protein